MSKDQKTKHSIHASARQISREVGALLDMEFDSDALDLIAELAWKKLLLYAPDLEAFEKHAKRTTITTDDVKLLVRRNDSLKELLESRLKVIESLRPPLETTSASAAATSTANKRKRKATGTS